MPLTVGTAGHIDHGKTALVRALTGKDTDRLPEEQRRGISIDLGYAPLDLPDGRRLSLVDVPGHERFVRAMVAGATGIDLFLLVIDAAEGARPQTHEHLAILQLLDVPTGVVAVTKSDLVDEETLEIAIEEGRELVPEAEVVAVSARTGAGLDALRSALARAADAVPAREAGGPARLYVDRVFTLRGIGTVVTGTLWAGTIAAGDTLSVAPRGGEVRVRTVQVHDEDVTSATAGERVALGLPGIDRRALHRGDALVSPGAFPGLVPARRRAPGARRRSSVDDASPCITAPHESPASSHVSVSERRSSGSRRRSSPRAVIGSFCAVRPRLGGGTVLDPAPPRRLEPRRLALLEAGDPASIVAATVTAPVPVESLAARALLTPVELEEGLGAVMRAGDWIFSREWLDEMSAAVVERLRVRTDRVAARARTAVADLLPPEPWAPPFCRSCRSSAAARWPTCRELRRRSARERRPPRCFAVGSRPRGLAAVKVDDAELARYLEAEGALVRLGDGFVVSAAAYDRARELVVTECGRPAR